ncbi:hypothetical protein [Shewanella sp. GutDb-MelDb]|uniref:hypothetical protein n=1 Tax=Shewanella sp. GutDb-MelDb TaxID=2058316 RepID=UPI0035B54BD1
MFPVEAFAITAVLDRLIDMVLNSCHMVGDTAVLTIIDETEKCTEATLAMV